MSYLASKNSLPGALRAVRRMRRPLGLGADIVCNLDYETAKKQGLWNTSPNCGFNAECIALLSNANQQFQAWWDSTGGCHSATDTVPDFGRQVHMGAEAAYVGGPTPVEPSYAGTFSNPAVPAVPVYAPKVSFSTASGNTSTPKAGDSWTVRIAGGPPNAAVTVNARNSTTPMGATDPSGSWSLSGTFSAADLGAWSEVWTVGGLPAGSFSFDVQAIASAPVGSLPLSSAADSGSTAAGGSGSSSGTLPSEVPSWFAQNAVDGIPNWALVLAALGVSAFVFRGK